MGDNCDGFGTIYGKTKKEDDDSSKVENSIVRTEKSDSSEA